MTSTMNRAKYLLALVFAALLAVMLAGPAYAAGTGTITITPPSGVDSEATNTYTIYKVFDADGDGQGHISYKLVSGKTEAPEGFTVDTAGNVSYTGSGTDGQLTADDIAAIADYVTDADIVDTATSTGTAAAVSKALPNGYYYITTSTGTVVTIDSTNPDARVNDKNEMTVVVKSAGTQYDKDSLAAIAAVGTNQSFTAQITKGKGAKNVVFTDTMTNMTYNGDAVVTVNGAAVDPSPTTFTAAGAVGDASFTLTFNNDYIAGLADGATITINYSGKVTSAALSTNPATNKAKVTSGDNGRYTSESGEVDVYNAKFTVTKKNGNNTEATDDDEPLAGAGFVIANADGKYYQLAADGKSIAWVDSIGDATEYTSDATGAVPAFTGLADGTYTLIEKTVPASYNKAADSTFTIVAGNYESGNLEQTSTVANHQGSVLPSTGGIGTTIFYVVGGILVAVAVVFLITRKRVANARKDEEI